MFNFGDDFAPGLSVINGSIVYCILCFNPQELLQCLNEQGNDTNITFRGFRNLVDIFGQLKTKIFKICQKRSMQ
ncbi:MAG: hypothetical protein CML80_05060 [Rhodobiaceae bacterium]|nr:hypothetical protein [Rhodobiaceae bacterium]OUT91793.1 MAG: hypothetical protein CBB89_05855 [Rhizobiales bacterium TMED29]